MTRRLLLTFIIMLVSFASGLADARIARCEEKPDAAARRRGSPQWRGSGAIGIPT
jgi:hypothetical protein